jgi:hypothetical protein
LNGFDLRFRKVRQSRRSDEIGDATTRPQSSPIRKKKKEHGKIGRKEEENGTRSCGSSNPILWENQKTAKEMEQGKKHGDGVSHRDQYSGTA